MPTVLGWNATHDAAAAIVKGGRIVLAVEEERLSRVKHHFGTPHRAMALCLERAGLSFEELEHCAFYMNPGLWLRSYGRHFVAHLPRSASYLGRRPALWRTFLGVERRFRRETGFSGRFHAVDHHAAHIDSAFWPSGFEAAAALTVDGAGEAATTVLGRVDTSRQERLRVECYPRSVGKVWEAVTDWLGFRPTRDEGKVMGLAPHGTPRFVEAFGDVLAAREGGTFHQDLAFFQYQYGAHRLVSDEFVARFGAARAPDGPLEDHHRDVAYALQQQTEEVVLALARHLREATGLPRLVMAGGVALNCVANGRVAAEGIFDEVFVQPAAGDNGAALGAALFVAHRKLGAQRSPEPFGAYLGPACDEAEALRAAQERGLVAERPENVVERTAEMLADGEIVGWVQGEMEFGPRALGNRSILADPRAADMADRVNARVKFREPFRPFAPAVPLGAAAEWFDGSAPSPFMLFTCGVRPERRAQIPAVTHVDGSARLQTVARGDNPRFHDLLEAFGRRTGVPVLLNTSFNVRGEPIVCRAAEALDALARTGLDAVVVGETVFRRSRPPPVSS